MPREIVTVTAPCVTVVIPCFNQGRYLAEAIGSARLAYTGPLEVIIVDDGSTDPKTERWLREAESMGDYVKVVRQKNHGLSGARNAGLRVASGDFVQFLDSDDLIIPGKLDVQVAHFATSPFLDISVSNFLLCDDKRNNFSKPDEAIAQFDLTLDDFLYKWERGFVIPIHCALFKRSVIGEAPFDEESRAKEDWIFWCSLVSKGARLSYAYGHWAIYRQHAESMRRSYVAMGKSWLRAALKVDRMVANEHPGFFDSAIAWFNDCYRAHPSYREEIESGSIKLSRLPLKDEAGVSDASSIGAVNVEKLVERLAILRTVPNDPLISVVIPVYNHFEHFVGCLTSLAAQGNVSFEVVCIDDASTDTRLGILLDMLSSKLPALRVVRHTINQGISTTQNEAVELARGQYVAFLDCDDALESGALEQVAQVIAGDEKIDYVFTDRYDIDAEGTVVRNAKYGGYPTILPSADRSIRDDLLDGMVASHLKVIRRSAYLSVGGTSDHYTGCQDWELALKIAEFGQFAYLPRPLYRHRIHMNSVTSSDQVAQFRKTNQLRRIHGKRCLWPLDSGMAEKPPSTHFDTDMHGALWFTAKHRLPALEDLKRAWSRGATCCFDLRGPFDIVAVNFLREFNSYFDRIIWDDPAVPGALIGYLWADHVIAV
jgi:glycosyltransferase involved in cell wall biosynthesis